MNILVSRPISDQESVKGAEGYGDVREGFNLKDLELLEMDCLKYQWKHTKSWTLLIGRHRDNIQYGMICIIVNTNWFFFHKLCPFFIVLISLGRYFCHLLWKKATFWFSEHGLNKNMESYRLFQNVTTYIPICFLLPINTEAMIQEDFVC